jgi:RNA polymerase sigma-70 factor (ECF subfamily)
MSVRRPAQVELDSAHPSIQPSPLESAIGAEATAQYTAALSRLAPEEREAVVARIELGYSFEQIATITSKRTPDAARMMVSRAVAKLAREMAHGTKRKDA